MVMCARVHIEQEPNYTYVTSRLLLDQLRSEALGFLDITDKASPADMVEFYPQALPIYLKRGVELELLSPDLLKYDLAKIADAIEPVRDLQFTYLGLQTLYDRYFLHSNDVRFELPQLFFMRVAMGLAMNEADREARATYTACRSPPAPRVEVRAPRRKSPAPSGPPETATMTRSRVGQLPVMPWSSR